MSRAEISGIRKHHVRKRAVKQSGTGAWAAGWRNAEKEELHRFHDTLYESYRTLFARMGRRIV